MRRVSRTVIFSVFAAAFVSGCGGLESARDIDSKTQDASEQEALDQQAQADGVLELSLGTGQNPAALQLDGDPALIGMPDTLPIKALKAVITVTNAGVSQVQSGSYPSGDSYRFKGLTQGRADVHVAIYAGDQLLKEGKGTAKIIPGQTVGAAIYVYSESSGGLDITIVDGDQVCPPVGIFHSEAEGNVTGVSSSAEIGGDANFHRADWCGWQGWAPPNPEPKPLPEPMPKPLPKPLPVDDCKVADSWYMPDTLVRPVVSAEGEPAAESVAIGAPVSQPVVSVNCDDPIMDSDAELTKKILKSQAFAAFVKKELNDVAVLDSLQARWIWGSVCRHNEDPNVACIALAVQYAEITFVTKNGQQEYLAEANTDLTVFTLIK